MVHAGIVSQEILLSSSADHCRLRRLLDFNLILQRIDYAGFPPDEASHIVNLMHSCGLLLTSSQKGLYLGHVYIFNPVPATGNHLNDPMMTAYHNECFDVCN